MARTTIRTEDITASEVTTAKMATDPTNASNLSSGSVPTAQLGNVDTSGLEDDIALLGFKVASNGSLAKYNLVDQAVDDFQDTSGVDASASTNEIRDGTGNFYSGAVAITGATTVFTAATTATWTAPDPAPPLGVEVLVVAGGGGGGKGTLGGGGGGSGVVHDTDYAVVAGTVYDLSVGAGGAGSTSDGANGTNGVDSIWNINTEGSGLAFTAKGGGGGASVDISNARANEGGCGGGSGDNQSGGSPAASTQASFTGATSYGTTGGKATRDSADGGGGAGESGDDLQSGNTIGGPGGHGKQFITFNAYGSNRAASYSGPGQVGANYSTGDRRASQVLDGNDGTYITVSTDLSIYTGDGTIETIVNGVTANSNPRFYPNGEAVVGNYFKFDFGARTAGNPILTGARWYQDTTATQGVWKWQGSDNDLTWTDIGASFTLGDGATGTSTPQIQTTMSANTTAYRYYQLEGVSGSCVGTAYWLEIEFLSGGWFAGGGAGASRLAGTVNDVNGGVGGGGYSREGQSAGDNALVNTGGGGGGGASGGDNGGSGGTGFIGISYPSFNNYNNMTLVSNATTAEAVPTKGDMVLTYTNGAGTNVVNTDIKGYVSRDNGSNYTQGTLVSQGTTGGHTILSFHDLSISSQPSGSSMRYKIETLNQSISKYANIQAVSLGWS